MLPAFPAQPPPFTGSPQWEGFGEDTRMAPRRSRVLQTEDGTSPHSEFRNRLTVWGRFGAAAHAADWCHRCSRAGGSPLITSHVQGEALDATCISSPTPAFPWQPALADTRGRHSKGSKEIPCAADIRRILPTLRIPEHG